MRVDWWTLGLQAVNALVLVWILARFFFRPISAIMTARQAAADAILADAENAKEKARSAEEKAEAEARRLAEERSVLMERAATEAEAAKAALLATAREQADKIRNDAKTSIAVLKEREMSEAALYVGQLAAELSEKLLSRLPDVSRIAGFVEGLGEVLGKLPEETRNGIGKNGEVIQLRAPRNLRADEIRACQAMLENVLGRKVTFEIEVAPALIAGLELRSSHALVRNSFRADLDRLEMELGRHE